MKKTTLSSLLALLCIFSSANSMHFSHYPRTQVASDYCFYDGEPFYTLCLTFIVALIYLRCRASTNNKVQLLTQKHSPHSTIAMFAAKDLRLGKKFVTTQRTIKKEIANTIKINNFIATQCSPDIFSHHIELTNTNTSDTYIIPTTKKQPRFIFPNESNLLIYSTHEKDSNGPILKIITTDKVELYSKNLPNTELTNEYSYTISGNNQTIAINFNHQNSFDIVSIDNLHTTARIATLNGHCDYINNDGSFYAHTRNAIRLYESNARNFVTLCSTDQEHPLLKVKILPERRYFKYSYHSAVHNEPYYKQLLEAETHSSIKKAVENLTPPQSLLLTKACHTTRNQHEFMNIPNKSVDFHALQSFGEHKEFIADILKLQITD